MNIRSKFICLTACVVVFILAAMPAQGQDQPTTVAGLIKRLGSETFSQRQSASKSLFQKGPSVLPQLQQVPLSSNPELNQRVGDLIKLLSSDIDASSGEETFDAVLKFEDAEPETRKQLLKRLLAGEHYGVYFRMVERLPVDQAEDVFRESRLRHLIPNLCEKNQWDDIETILSHRLTWKYEPNLCGLYHRTMGTLDVHLDQMKREIDNAEFVDATQLSTLIGLLKAEESYDAALRYAQRFDNADLVNAYQCQILMESGNWKALSDRAVLGDRPVQSDRYFRCNRMTYPMVKFWGGSEKDFQDAIEEVSEKSIVADDDADGQQNGGPPLENKETFSVDPILQQIHLLTLNWDALSKGLEITEDPNSISLLSLINRYDLMLDQLKIGTDFASHKAWASKQRQAIEKAVEEFPDSRVRNNRQRRRDLVQEIESKVVYFLSVCDVLADLGMEAEAILFIRQLYHVIHSTQELAHYRAELIGRVADYGDAEALWDFIENAGLTTAQVKSLVYTRRSLQTASSPEAHVLFGHKNEVAQFVFDRLRDKIDDPIERLKHVACVVNYQLKPSSVGGISKTQIAADTFNLDTDIGLFEHNQSAEACWNVSQIYAFHQRQEYQQWLQHAAFKGDARAIKQIAIQQFNNQQYLDSAEMFEQEFALSLNPLSLSRAAEAYGLAGDTQKSKRLTFHAFVLPDFIYDNNFNETYGSYLEDERADLIADQLRFRIATTPESNSTYAVIYGWQILQKHDPVAASNLLRIRLLTISNNAALRQLALAITSHTLDATADVIQGNYGRTQRTLDRLLKFSPSIPSIAEQTVVQLDLAGQKAMGDAVIKKLVNGYKRLLTQYPASPTHCNNFAWILACGKRHANIAIGHAQTAVQRRPHSAGFFDTLAESHYAAEEFDNAIETIDRATAIEPENEYYKNQRLKYEAAQKRKR